MMLALAGCATAGPAANAGSEAENSVAELPPSPMGHFLAGRYATDQRDLGAAADLLAVALAADPENTDLLRDTYLAMVSDGRMAEAADLARRLVAAGVEGTPAELTLALEAVKAGNYAVAREYLSRLPQDGFSGFIIPLLDAWVAFETDGVDAALAIADTLIDIRGLEPVRGIQAGLIAEQGGRAEPAAAAFASAIEVAGQPPFRMVEIIGNYYQRSGRRDEAADLYAQFVAANPGTVLAQAFEARLAEETPAPIVDGVAAGLAEVMFDAASILRQEKSTDIALIYTRMALDLEPDLVIARLLLADILEEQERHDEAIEAYRALPEDSPLSWQARLNLADLLDRNDRTDEAIALLRQMTDERSDQVDPPQQLGSVFRIHQRFAEAAAAYDIAVQRLGEPTPERWSLFYFRGIAYERSGAWEKAEADFLKALELSPDHPYVLNYLAYSWIEQGINYDRALDMLQQAVTLRPGDGFIVDSLGWVYFRLGEYELAVEQLEKANELLPTDPVLNDHLGDAYWRVGRHNEARYQWLRALQFGAEEDQIPLIQAKIDSGLGEPPPPPPGLADPSGS
jgi:tetratricopeptide (TPR) repeat protein